MRLDWQDVERRPGFIEVAAHKAKTATRRIVPISDNLSRWLAIAPRSSSERVWPHSKAYFFEALRTAADNARIKWKQNALRHSFISYRLAEIQDVNRVALEAGNSPQMIFRHYRELATPQQAKTWFAIAPETAANVVPIAAAPQAMKLDDYMVRARGLCVVRTADALTPSSLLPAKRSLMSVILLKIKD